MEINNGKLTGFLSSHELTLYPDLTGLPHRGGETFDLSKQRKPDRASRELFSKREFVCACNADFMSLYFLRFSALTPCHVEEASCLRGGPGDCLLWPGRLNHVFKIVF